MDYVRGLIGSVLVLPMTIMLRTAMTLLLLLLGRPVALMIIFAAYGGAAVLLCSSRGGFLVLAAVVDACVPCTIRFNEHFESQSRRPLSFPAHKPHHSRLQMRPPGIPRVVAQT